ncbi:adenylosuccinate synthetase [Paenibacillus sp. J5C_2022]|uniref:adenylosuccinate synthetase n=1 Tax=Paenibacillus sp. J5C2022 TaxID=2977129 RepID=UPI0021D1688E|nr:adenylosuccinate synthetase [Paenibacillus sp. J5C2022]MCU6709603.1 adenylosuccinate synthetase [Paenibacillus sp. J5C2022]
MKTAKVVIGANYGDEGKGLMTDYFASQSESGIVIRFNGGAQAGHCQTGDTLVLTPYGIRYLSEMASLRERYRIVYNRDLDGEAVSSSLREENKLAHRIMLSNGVQFKCTDAHPYYVWDRQLGQACWVQSGDLNKDRHLFLFPKAYNGYRGANIVVGDQMELIAEQEGEIIGEEGRLDEAAAADASTPVYIMEGCLSIIASYLKGLFQSAAILVTSATDRGSSCLLVLRHPSLKLLREVQQMLFLLGVPGNLRCRGGSYGVGNSNGERECLYLYGTGSDQLREMLGLKLKTADKRYGKIGRRLRSRQTVKAAEKAEGADGAAIIAGRQHGWALPDDTVEQYHTASIRRVERNWSYETVYDLTLPLSHSYIANGAISHNTVVTPGGKEHVFSHFGSGALLGLPTYLSSFFLMNPILFAEEYDQLHAKLHATVPKVFADGEAMVTTPYDMLINQIVETVRGEGRHGSCGLGISETVVRCEEARYRTVLSQCASLHQKGQFIDLLRSIRDEYVPARLAELGVSLQEVPDIFRLPLFDEGVLAAYLQDFDLLLGRTTLSDANLLAAYDNLVFEGAQGLLLDQHLEQFSPHITHSTTGIGNVLHILDAITDSSFLQQGYQLEVCYVTRAYLTRHGAGPLPKELDELPYPQVYDPTNSPNEWQGALRYGYLDLDSMLAFIGEDAVKVLEAGKQTSVSIAVTCLDQTDGKVIYYDAGELKSVAAERFPSRLSHRLSQHMTERGTPLAVVAYGSWGRTREAVRRLKGE